MKRPLALLGILVCASSLAACSVTHPVHGTMDDGTQFLGSATGYLDGNGDINMTLDDGRHCIGQYKWTGTPQAANSRGTFTCDDGLSGTFASAGTAASSVGFGNTSDGHKFKFYTGDSTQVQTF